MSAPIPINAPRRGARPHLDYQTEVLAELVPQILAQLGSKHSKRMYARYLHQFLSSQRPLTREGVALYLDNLRERGAKGGTLKIHIAAINKLVREAELLDLLSYKQAHAIREIKRDPVVNRSSGNWLTIVGAKALIASIDRETPTGKRDAAMFALLLGAGLRREEACTLRWGQYMDREGRKILLNVDGKGRKSRSVPMAPWAVPDMELWKEETKRLTGMTDQNLERFHVLRRFRKTFAVDNTSQPELDASKAWKRSTNGTPETVPQVDNESGAETPETEIGSIVVRKLADRNLGNPLTAMGCWWLVKKCAAKINVQIAPHDMRRTLAQMMRNAGVAIEQIQFQLGHSSVKTTEIYLSGDVELMPGRAGVDQIDWEPSWWKTGKPE